MKRCFFFKARGNLLLSDDALVIVLSTRITITWFQMRRTVFNLASRLPVYK